MALKVPQQRLGRVKKYQVLCFTVVHVRTRQKLIITLSRKRNYIDMNSIEEILFQNPPFVVPLMKQFAYL